MYESIEGILKEKDPSRAIVTASGIGYRLAIPLSTYTQLPALDKAVTLYLTQVVREDAHTLYAFIAKEERNLFEMLISLSGIGPKTALSIIGHVDLAAFHRAINAADIRLLSKIPGIGKKTAERLVIEMRDKLKGGGKNAKSETVAASGDSLTSDAINALLNLGYNLIDAQKAVQRALAQSEQPSDLGGLITRALNSHN